ncbi:MAG: AraC family transcriptional regulator [Tannerellaceae bacterium]|jgi:AraC-like DNA-binding protein/mannose-6-phosphate isomerase-like protein (cupin superfamily)|nr:AraC family transcriptional regulator [Tannerellaceae bacterium]
MNQRENLNLILLNAARKAHYADWNWKGVYSPFARLYMVESGEAKVIMPDGTYTIRPGYLYLIPSFVVHSCENDGTFTIYYMHIYDEQNIFDRLNFPFEVTAGDMDVMLMKRLLAINPGRELVRSDPDTYDNFSTLMQTIAQNDRFPFSSVVETKGILLQLFSRFLEKASSKQEITDKRIVKILRYIRENIDKNISIDELSSICYLSKDHFIRLFRKEMQCTPIQYINQKKIEKAQLMLVIGEKSIKDITYSLAFENMSYFYRLFKKMVGIPPNQYKAQSNLPDHQGT